MWVTQRKQTQAFGQQILAKTTDGRSNYTKSMSLSFQGSWKLVILKDFPIFSLCKTCSQGKIQADSCQSPERMNFYSQKLAKNVLVAVDTVLLCLCSNTP